MRKTRFKPLVLGGIFTLISLQPAWASISETPWSEKAQEITLTESDKTSIWASPWVPTGISVVMPGMGQIYQSDPLGPERDWFLLARGALYLAVMGIGYWQLFDNMGAFDPSRKNASMVTLWSVVLMAANLASPVDAFVSGSFKQAHEEELAQKQQERATALQRIYENILSQASQGDYETAIQKAESFPSDAPQFAELQNKIPEWRKTLLEQKAAKTFDEAYETAKKGDFAKAIEGALSVPAGTTVYEKAQQKAQEWQKIIDERKAKRLWDQAQELGKAKKYAKAVEKLKAILPGTYYYPKAQELIKQWEQGK